MKPLVVLLIVFIVSLIITWLIRGMPVVGLSGRIAMSVMLLFTSLGHFKFSKGMQMMMPPFVPFKRELVLLTGFIEMIAAIGLLINPLKEETSILLVLFFLLILPANIYAAIKGVDYENATYSGKGLTYLWFRVPLQLLFIAWVLYFSFY